jgi:ribosome-binding protein aMBF1 (putative translation factor)
VARRPSTPTGKKAPRRRGRSAKASSPFLTLVGQRLSEARSALGLTQDELAEKAGVDRSYVSDMERGIRNFSVLALLDLAEALGVQAGDLLKR